MHKFGTVVLTHVQFTDTFEMKTRPAVVLFEEYGNIVVAGITSNEKMKGIPLTKKEGAMTESVIKLNYLFTISHAMIKKELFILPVKKKQILSNELMARLAIS